jgi:hypothetical protein
MHRVQLRQVSGEWDWAAEEARVVSTGLVGMNTAVVAEGHYLLGYLLRLGAKVADAESAYLRARELGRDPQPGRNGPGRRRPAVLTARRPAARARTAHGVGRASPADQRTENCANRRRAAAADVAGARGTVGRHRDAE